MKFSFEPGGIHRSLEKIREKNVRRDGAIRARM